MMHGPGGRPGRLAPLVALALLPASSAFAVGGVVLTDVAAEVGITYERVPSADHVFREANYVRGVITAADMWAEPLKWAGAPGVVLFDPDGDGDTDIFATNGPGAANSLYENQVGATGTLSFVDVATSAGVALPLMDGMGACAGDIDNDGDQDLYVLGRDEENRLLENLGDGTFVEITSESGTGAGLYSHSACTMGDVNGDGLLDIFVANTLDLTQSTGIYVEPYLFNQPNQLFVNIGRNEFIDDSARAGVQNVAEITWGTAMVDYDLDGDMDILTVSDNAAIPAARHGGVDRGLHRVYRNDGQGNFTDVTFEANLSHSGDWMGVTAGDFNCDGYMDFFATNFGDHVGRVVDPWVAPIGDYSSRWLLGGPNGVFSDPGPGALVSLPFGWGASVLDYDNDADPDIIYNGSLHHGFFHTADNPGALLQNRGCNADFVYDDTAVLTDHGLRSTHGSAVSDLDQDGFVDVVTVSSENKAPDTEYLKLPNIGSPFDARARWVEVWYCDGTLPACPLYYTGATTVPGTITVERNSGGNGNRSVQVRTVGAVDLIAGGAVNRDGVGAVVSFTPDANGAERSMSPVTAGSSHASQDDMLLTFGLGTAKAGTVEVLWPGGVRNRLYGVAAGEKVRFPEIPCSFAGSWESQAEYETCVDTALAGLVGQGVISQVESDRFRTSAVKAFKKQ